MGSAGLATYGMVVRNNSRLYLDMFGYISTIKFNDLNLIDACLNICGNCSSLCSGPHVHMVYGYGMDVKYKKAEMLY